jgi:hypothetical protein
MLSKTNGCIYILKKHVADRDNDVEKFRGSSQEAKFKSEKSGDIWGHLGRAAKRLPVSLTIDEVPMHECSLLSI